MPLPVPTETEMRRDRARGVPENALRAAALLYPAGAATAAGWQEIGSFVEALTKGYTVDPGPMLRSLRRHSGQVNERAGAVVLLGGDQPLPLEDAFLAAQVLRTAEGIAQADLAGGANHMTQGGMAWDALGMLPQHPPRPPHDLVAFGNLLHRSMNAAAATRLLQQNAPFPDYLRVEVDDDIEAVRITTPGNLDFHGRKHGIYSDRLMLSCGLGLSVALLVRTEGADGVLVMEAQKLDLVGPMLVRPKVGGLRSEAVATRVCEWAAAGGGVTIDPAKSAALPKTWGHTMQRQDVLNAIAGAALMFDLECRERDAQRAGDLDESPGPEFH